MVIALAGTPTVGTTATGTTGTSVAAAKPTATGGGALPVGTFLEACIVSNINAQVNPAEVASGAWVVVQNATTTALSQIILRRFLDGSEGSTITFTGLTSARHSVILRPFSGVDQSNPLDVAVPTRTAGTTAITYPAVTPVTAGAWIVTQGASLKATGPTITWTAGNMDAVDATTGAVGTNSTANGFSAAARKAWTSGSFTPTGPAHSTSVASTRTIGQTYVLRPASAVAQTLTRAVSETAAATDSTGRTVVRARVAGEAAAAVDAAVRAVAFARSPGVTSGVSYSDPFTGPAGPLGASWVDTANPMTLDGAGYVLGASAVALARYATAAPAVGVLFSEVIYQAGAGVGVAVAVPEYPAGAAYGSGAGEFYVFRRNNADATTRLVRKEVGSANHTVVADLGPSLVSGDVIAVTYDETTGLLRGFVNGSVVLEYLDPAPIVGQRGVGIHVGSAGPNGSRIMLGPWNGGVLGGTGETARAADGTAGVVARVTLAAVSETASAVDAVARSTVRTRPTVETASAVDAVARSTARGRVAAETAPAVDSTTRGMGRARTTVEAASAVDGAARSRSSARVGVEAAPAADTAARSVQVARTPIDAAGGADTGAQRVTARTRGLVEAAPAADAVARSRSSARAAGEVADGEDTAARAVTVGRTRAETAPAVDVTAPILPGVRRATTEQAPAADAVARGAVRSSRGLTEFSPAGDSASAGVAYGRTRVEVAPAVDVAARAVGRSRATAETAPAADTPRVGGGVARGTAEAAPASDTTATGVARGRSLAESAVTSDTAVRSLQVGRGRSESAAASDAVSRGVAQNATTNEAAPTADVPAAKVGAAYVRTFVETATATDATTRLTRFSRPTVETAGGIDAAPTVRAEPVRGTLEDAPAADLAAAAAAYARDVLEDAPAVDAVTVDTVLVPYRDLNATRGPVVTWRTRAGVAPVNGRRGPVAPVTTAGPVLAGVVAGPVVTDAATRHTETGPHAE